MPRQGVYLTHPAEYLSGMQIIIEPPDLFLRRAEEKQREVDWFLTHPTEHLSGWDEAAMRFFIAQPNLVMLQVRVANELVKQCSARTKPAREAAKIEILRALGRLMRQRRLTRVGRRSVRVNAAEVPRPPVIPLDEFRRNRRALEASLSAGSAPPTGVIHPAIFV